MRKHVKVSLATVMVLALLIGALGCAGSAPPTQTAAPAAATAGPAAQPAGQVIELRYHHHDPAQSYTHQNAHLAFAKMIEEKSGGRIKVTVYPAETLGKSATAIDMAINGIADLSWGFIGQFPGRFPVSDMLGLPKMDLQTGVQGSRAIFEAYQTSPEIQKEWEQVHLILLHTTAPHRLAFGSKKVQTMEDMKGLRIRSLGGAPLRYLQALGANPVTVPAPESFEGIQKGTIDGATFDWNGIGSFRLDDICKYVLEDDFYPSTFFLIMNKKRWDSLSPDLQKMFDDLAPIGVDLYGKAWQDGSDQYKKTALGKGVQVLTLSAEESARWRKAAESVWEEQVKLADAKGANGKALLDKVRTLMAKHKQ